MKNLILVVLLAFFTTGCGNLSPREDGRIGRINNKNGQISGLKEEVKNLQGSIDANNKITAQKIDNLQQGIITTRKDNTNQGVQILQGDGVLVLILALGTLLTVSILGVLYYKSKSDKSEKATQVLADEVAMHNDPDLEDRIFVAARHAGLQKEILDVLANSKRKFRIT